MHRPILQIKQKLRKQSSANKVGEGQFVGQPFEFV